MPRDKNTSSLKQGKVDDKKKIARRTTRLENLVPEDALAKQRALDATNRRNQSREERAAAKEARNKAVVAQKNTQTAPSPKVQPTAQPSTMTELFLEEVVSGSVEFSREDVKNHHQEPTLEPLPPLQKISLTKRRPRPPSLTVPTPKPAAPAPSPIVPETTQFPPVVLTRCKSHIGSLIKRERTLHKIPNGDKPKARLHVGGPEEKPKLKLKPKYIQIRPPPPPQADFMDPPPQIKTGPVTRPHKKRKREHDSLDVHFGNKHARKDNPKKREVVEVPPAPIQPKKPKTCALNHFALFIHFFSKSQSQIIADYITTLSQHLLSINDCLTHLNGLHFDTPPHVHDTDQDTADISSWTDRYLFLFIILSV